MCKKIKFNLELDGKKVRDIKDIKDNFNISDMLFYFEQGILERWLDLRSDNTERIEKLKVLKNLDIENDNEKIKIIKELANIFENDEHDDDDEIRKRLKRNHSIKANITSIPNQEQRPLEEYCTKYKNLINEILKFSNNKETKEIALNISSKSILGSYAPFVPSGILKLISGIQQKIVLRNVNLEVLKQNIHELEQYKELLKIDLSGVFKELINKQIIAIFYLLANTTLREIILKDEIIKKEIKDNYSLHTNNIIFEEYNNLIKERPFKTVKVQKNKPANLDFKHNNKNVMIINVPLGINNIAGIVPKGKRSTYNLQDINGNYIIFEDVQFKSESINDLEVTYMEIDLND